MVVYLAVEGDSDVPVAERMIRSVGLEPYRAVVARGKSQLDPRIPDLNRSGTRLNWLILRDLDHDAPCASALIEHLVPHARLSPRVSLRIPVRAMESWILADADGFARAFSVKRARLPESPDDLDDPKLYLVNVCRDSRRPAIQKGMVPRTGSGRPVGPEYAVRISAFARQTWDPGQAAQRSPSLSRTLSTLRGLVANGIWS